MISFYFHRGIPDMDFILLDQTIDVSKGKAKAILGGY